MRPNPIRILSQDFPDDVKPWINRLIGPMNQFMTALSTLLNKGITFKDHINAEIKTITLTSTDSPIISCSLKSKPIGAVVICSNQELKNPLFLDWVNTEKGIKIRRVLGLEQKKAYTLTLLIIGG